MTPAVILILGLALVVALPGVLVLRSALRTWREARAA
jgi:hypothetical protein